MGHGRTMAIAGSLLTAALVGGVQAQAPMERPAGTPMAAKTKAAGSILPTGLGEAIDRDVAKLNAATERFKSAEAAIAAGWPRTSDCVEHQPHGAMGFHFQNNALADATLDVEQPEVLVYEKRPDGSFQLNGVEYLVPIPAWTKAEPPSIMGQRLKRADSLGIWYLHVWNWTPNPSGLFADWNPDVKC